MDNINELRVNENLKLLYEIKKEYDFDFVSQYSEFSNRVTRVEFSKGGNMHPFGYYSFNLLNKLTSTNNRRGKLYNHEVSGFNYKYSFEENHLIMIEKFDDGVRIESFFIHHLKLEKIIIIYLSLNFRRNPKPAMIEFCFFDEEGKLKKYLSSNISTTFDNIEENIYEYSQSELIIKRFSYHQSVGATQFKDMVFPLSVLDEKTKIQTTKKVSCDTIKKILKDNWISIMQSWKIQNGYAISIILHNQMTIEIDYAEEDKSNQDPYCEQRWDYTYWNQHSKPLLQKENERKFFETWLDQYEENHQSNESLIENKKFISILSSIIKELRDESTIKNCFGKEVPIIVTNFDLDNSILKLNMKLNDSALLVNYSKWFEDNIMNYFSKSNEV